MSITRRQFLEQMGLAAGGLALAGLAGCAPRSKTLEKLLIQAPASPPSVALAKLVHDRAFEGLAGSAEFALWKDPDELRGRITGGQAHISGLSVNVAATLYNKGLGVKLTSVYIWGILYVVSADPNIRAWADLKGQELLIPFKGDLPDILGQLLMQQRGLELGKDIQPRYVSAAPEAAGLLAAGQARHAILSEPSATLAFLKAKEAGVALYRVIDMQKDWAAVTGRPARLPMAGVVVLPGLAQDHPQILQRLRAKHAEAVAWVRQNPAEAARLGATYIPTMPEAAMAASMPYIQLEYVDAAAARPEIEFFFQQLARLSPALYGNALPDDKFYAAS
jgi:NitT/TauT family transport system substrate-binding protein